MRAKEKPNVWLDLSREEIGLLANVMNEVLNGLEIRDFPRQVGASRDRAEMVLRRFNEAYGAPGGAGNPGIEICREDARILRAALTICIRELGESEISPRTGLTIPEAERHAQTLDEITRDLPVGRR